MNEDFFWNKEETVNQFAQRPCSSYIVDEINRICKLTNPQNAIDIGCGGGRYAKLLSQKKIKVLAIDKNLGMVNRVKTFGIQAIHCDMSNINTQKCFDLVLSIGVLHNATTKHELIRSIAEISRVLKIEKYAIVSIFTNQIITDDLTYINNCTYHLSDSKPPMTLCSKEEIIQLFDNSNLKLEKIIDEHITNVGTGERNVLSLCLRKQF